MDDIFFSNSTFHIIQASFGFSIYDARDAVTHATIAAAFANHFVDQFWKYSCWIITALFLDYKRWIVEPVGCDGRWTEAFCCEKKSWIND